MATVAADPTADPTADATGDVWGAAVASVTELPTGGAKTMLLET